MKLAFSWDDGAPQDQRLFELHEKYKIPGMFFIPTRNREGRDVISPEMMRDAESQYVRFGGHTQSHVYLTTIPLEDVNEEVRNNKDYLENTLGHEIDDFCLPGGQYNDEILKIVYRSYKTIRTADTMNFRYTGGPLKPAIHFYPRGFRSLLGNCKRHSSNEELLYVATHPWKSYFRLISDLIDRESKKENSVVMIWGHSWELEEHDLWDELERLMSRVKQQYPQSIFKYEEMFES